MDDQQAWPEYLHTDYAAAAVRLTTVMQQREQHLLFACVELYPHEIPLPPKGVRPLQKRIGKIATLVSTIAVMPVRDALEWYESALPAAQGARHRCRSECHCLQAGVGAGTRPPRGRVRASLHHALALRPAHASSRTHGGPARSISLALA